MTTLILLIAVLMGLNYWLLEPALHASSDLMELKLLPWLLLGVTAWFVAGSPGDR